MKVVLRLYFESHRRDGNANKTELSIFDLLNQLFDMAADLNIEDSAFNRGIVVFSGGSAANSLVDAFNTVRASKQCLLNYVIPISDNGGSTSELIRIFGGPGIGDVRSE